ncbi:MAG TPA: hypothetical protein VL974_08925 [Magnetospirillum sp.]|nr:hypothetical protein [Magnetospirillum sp.]
MKKLATVVLYLASATAALAAPPVDLKAEDFLMTLRGDSRVLAETAAKDIQLTSYCVKNDNERHQFLLKEFRTLAKARSVTPGADQVAIPDAAKYMVLNCQEAARP